MDTPDIQQPKRGRGRPPKPKDINAPDEIQSHQKARLAAAQERANSKRKLANLGSIKGFDAAAIKAKMAEYDDSIEAPKTWSDCEKRERVESVVTLNLSRRLEIELESGRCVYRETMDAHIRALIDAWKMALADCPKSIVDRLPADLAKEIQREWPAAVREIQARAMRAAAEISKESQDEQR